MAVNKVIYGGVTLMDLSADTVTPDTLAKGITAHDRSGALIEGTMAGAESQIDDMLTGSITSLDTTVTSIIAYACRNFQKLKTVNLPNATSIGTYAFYGCTALTSVNAPKVTSLGSYVFYNCKIPYVNFPKVTAISQNAFYDCDLVKADFGVAKSVAQAAFAYCRTLEALILRKSDAICTLSVASNGFTSTPIAGGTGYIYVPKALLSDDDETKDYRRANNWKNYSSQFRAIEDYPEITGG